MPSIVTRLLLFAALMLSAPAVYADSHANLLRDGMEFVSKSGGMRAVVSGGATFFLLMFKGVEKYKSSSFNLFSRGQLFVADDGRHVTWMLSDHYYRTESEKDFPAMVFFKDGKIIKQYPLKEILVREDLVSESVSHTRWVTGSPVFDPNGSRLEFETTSLRRYVFDPRTGDMLESGDSDIYKEADLIVYGECIVESPGRVRMKNFGYVKKAPGISPPLVFSDPGGFVGRSWQAVALRRDGSTWVVDPSTQKLTVIYNTVPME